MKIGKRGRGRPPIGAGPKEASLSIRIEPALMDMVKSRASADKTSVSEEVARLLRSALGPDAPEPKEVADMRSLIREEVAAANRVAMQELTEIIQCELAAVGLKSNPPMVSVKDALKISGIGMTKLYELMNCGALGSVKVGKRRMVNTDSLKRLADRGWD